MERYEAVRYAAEGCQGEVVPGGDSDGDVIATGSIEECREAIAERVGAHRMAGLRWGGMSEDWDGNGATGDVEAYHESDEDGCGGWAIRLA